LRSRVIEKPSYYLDQLKSDVLKVEEMTIRSRQTWRGLALAGAALFAGLLPHQTMGESIEGFSEPWQVIDVAAAESGVVQDVFVEEGEIVQKGQTLASLDQEVLLAAREVAAAQAESTQKLDIAIAELGLREHRLVQLKKLEREGHASPEEIQSAETDVTIARARVAMAKNDLRLARLEIKRIEAQIRRRAIPCPIDGVVVQLTKNIGEFVAANDSKIAKVVQVSVLRVRMYVLTNQAVLLENGRSVPVTFPSQIEPVQGKIIFISPVTDSESDTVRVELRVENKGNFYRSGVRCQIEIPDVSVSES
jgi:RND family efflux transporter MFP subunit